MKRFLLAFLLGHICVFSFGQIQRSFWGASLGNSNTEEVLQKMRENDYTSVVKGNGSHIRTVSYNEPLSFANVEIANAVFSFYQGRCYQVKLSFNNNADNDGYNDFGKIKQAIGNKYRNFLKERKTKHANTTAVRLPTSPRREAVRPNATTFYYSDGKTTLTVDENEHFISYTDEKMWSKKDKADCSELYKEQDFLGCTLGITTYTEALKIISSLDTGHPDQKGSDFIEKSVTFAGSEYYARLSFYKGYFYKISFRNSPDDEMTDFKLLKRQLDGKYKDKCVKSDDGYAEYNNGKVLITLRRNRYGDSKLENITLEYTDVNSLNKKENVNLDEI